MEGFERDPLVIVGLQVRRAVRNVRGVGQGAYFLIGNGMGETRKKRYGKA
jgi:hypothetical protein